MRPSNKPLDLKQVALKLLEMAKTNLSRDGHLTPVAFLLRPEGVETIGLFWENNEQKERAYSDVVQRAKAVGVLAIITINEAYMKKLKSTEQCDRFVEQYKPGQLKDDHDSECIMLTVYPADARPWGVFIKYERRADGTHFGPETRMGAGEEGGPLEVGMLPGWGHKTEQKPA